MNVTMEMIGYFTHQEARAPTRNPGRTTPCPFCDGELGHRPMSTISFPRENDVRSYFVRAHTACWSAAGDDGQSALIAAAEAILDAHGGKVVDLRTPQ